MTDPAGCPGWCTANHGNLLVPGKPEYGTDDTHRTAVIASGHMEAYGVQHPGSEPEIVISDRRSAAYLPFEPLRAGDVAAMLRRLARDPRACRQLADAVEAAAASITGEDRDGD